MSPVADATWALDQLAERFPGRPIGVLGHSMGGRTALRVGGHSAVTAVAGLAPWLPPREPSAQLAGRSVLLAHGTADRMTDPAATAGFASRLRAEGTPVRFVRIPGEGHAMVRRAHRWHRLASGFLQEDAARCAPQRLRDGARGRGLTVRREVAHQRLRRVEVRQHVVVAEVGRQHRAELQDLARAGRSPWCRAAAAPARAQTSSTPSIRRYASSAGATRTAASPANDASSSMPAETPTVWMLAGAEAWPMISARADPATYSPISTPEEPCVASERNSGSPWSRSVSRWLIRDCTACAERHSASMVVSMASTRYAAWKPPWWVTVSGVVAVAGVKSGFSEEVLTDASTTDGQLVDGVQHRPVHLRPGAQAEEVLDVLRYDVLLADQPAHRPGDPRGAREGGRALDRRVHRLGVAPQAEPGQRGHRVGRVRQLRAAPARRARPAARVNALLDISGSASAEVSCSRCRRPPSARGRSPSSARPTSAQAVRSPVPRPPYRWTTGRSASGPQASSASATARSGVAPEPPTSSWLARIARAQRTTSAGSGSPHPAAWARSSRRPCATGALVISSRPAPTPVVRP